VHTTFLKVTRKTTKPSWRKTARKVRRQRKEDEARKNQLVTRMRRGALWGREAKFAGENPEKFEGAAKLLPAAKEEARCLVDAIWKHGRGALAKRRAVQSIRWVGSA